MSIWSWLFDGLGKKQQPAKPDPDNPFRVTDRLVELVKHYESFEPKAYWDAHGSVWTIGYGNTYYKDGSRVKRGDEISIEQATLLLTQVLNNCIAQIKNRNEASLSANHVVALASFLYNTGPGAKSVKDGLFALRNDGRPSTLWRMTQRGEFGLAAVQFDLWVNSSGKKLKGLQRRRRAERYIFDRNMTAKEAIQQAEKDFP